MFGEITNLVSPPVTASASGNTDSGRVSFSGAKPDGSFSLTIVVTGTGTATISYKTSLEPGGTYIAPVQSSVIATGLTAGTHVIPFSPVVTKNLKYNVLETGASNSVTAQITTTVS